MEKKPPSLEERRSCWDSGANYQGYCVRGTSHGASIVRAVRPRSPAPWAFLRPPDRGGKRTLLHPCFSHRARLLRVSCAKPHRIHDVQGLSHSSGRPATRTVSFAARETLSSRSHPWQPAPSRRRPPAPGCGGTSWALLPASSWGALHPDRHGGRAGAPQGCPKPAPSHVRLKTSCQDDLLTAF